MTDPPIHTRLRSPLTTAFSARRIAELEPAIQEIAAQLIETFPRPGPVDFVAYFAHLFPIRVICRLIGIPTSDHEQLRQWSDDFMELINRPLSPELQGERASSCLAIYSYIGRLLEQRRLAPQDDLATALLQATEQEQANLSNDELVELLVALLVAGFETTMHFLSACLWLLLRHHTYWETLNGDSRHIDRVVEEGLRLVSPNLGTFRITTREVQLGGVTIPANALVYAMTASANHDELQFPHPETIDLHRKNVNRHMVFGYGIHFCIGAPLARLEVRVALEALRQRFPHLSLVPKQTLTYKSGLIIRGLEQLFIELNEPSQPLA